MDWTGFGVLMVFLWAAVVVALDVWLMLTKRQTISSRMLHLSKQYPILGVLLGFLVGFLMAHLFFAQSPDGKLLQSRAPAEFSASPRVPLGGRPDRQDGPTLDVPPPTGDPATDRANIQSVFDRGAAYASNASAPALIRFPAGRWLVDRPLVLCRRYCAVQGAGPWLSRIVQAGGGHDVIALGIDPSPGGVTIGPDQLPDSFGIADTSFAPAPGARRGLRLLSAHVAQAGGGFDQADYPAARGLLVEMLADLSRLPAGGTASLCGLSDQGPRPWTLSILDGTLQLHLRTRAAGEVGQGAVRRFGGPVVPRRPVRMTVWADLDAGSVTLWMDGQKAPINPANGALPPGDRLAPPEGCHFGIGGFGRAAAAVADVYGGAADVTIHGLRVATTCDYDPANATLTRRDRAAIADGSRYLREGAGLVACLGGADDPADVAASRLVTVRAGNPAGGKSIPTSAYFLDNQAHLNPFGGAAWTTIAGLGLECSTPWYGDAIKAGGLTHCRFADLDLRGGARGLALFNWGSAYTLSGEDLYLAGRDCGLHLFGTSTARFSGLNFCFATGPGYRAGVRLIDSQATLADVFLPHAGTPDYAAYCRRSSIRAIGWQLDNEGEGGSQVADVYASPGEDAQQSTAVVLEDWRVANHGPGASALLLDGPPANGRGQVGDCAVSVKNFGLLRTSPLKAVRRVTADAAGLWRDAGVDFGTTPPGVPAAAGPDLLPAVPRPTPADHPDSTSTTPSVAPG